MPAKTGSIAVNSSTGYPKGLPFGLIGPPIARTGIIVNENGWSQPLGMQCVLYWANEDFVASISQDSDFKLVERGSNRKFTTEDKSDDPQGYHWKVSECLINGTTYPAKNPDGSWAQEQCNYYVGPRTQRGLENYFTDQTYGFSGSLLNNDNDTTHATPFLQNLRAITRQTQADTQDNIQKLWSNTALFMTRATRIVQTDSQLTTPGLMWKNVNYYHVYWYYLVPSGAMVFACTLFTLLVWLKTRHDYPWKDSSLPFLFLGLSSKEKLDFKDIRTLQEMKEAAELLEVKLGETPDDGLRFVRKEE